jgi:hypothetical protein
MSNYKSGLNLGKMYVPYPGHEAMCPIRKKEGMNTSSTFNTMSKKVTEGKKPPLLQKSKSSSAHGDRGYKTAKLKHK